MITDMTKGKPSSVLIRFSVPLLLSAMFQQFYNLADSIIAGNCIDENAFTAISASYPITMIYVAIALGCNTGCSVIVSNLFGAKKYNDMKTAIWTSFITVGILAVAVSVFGMCSCNSILIMLNTPGELMPDASSYLFIYAFSLVFVFLYNICNGIFTALGDSRMPLWFLIGSSVGNVLLDLIFVLVFKMGVSGIAFATFVAQMVASLFALFFLLRKVNKIEVVGTVKVFSFPIFKKICSISIPSICQQSFVSVGNVFIQGLVNSFGTAVMAGYAAAIKLNTFAVTTFVTVSNSCSNFTAQNIGAGEYKRVEDGFKTAIIISGLLMLPFMLAYLIFGRELVAMFINNPTSASIEEGYRFLCIVAPFYFSVAAKLTGDGVLKGSRTVICFVLTTFSDLIIRVGLAFILSPVMGADGIWWSWPVGWFISAVISISFYFSKIWKHEV